MVLRHILAALDHNFNCGRPQIGSKYVWSHAKKEYVVKAVYAPKSSAWRQELLQEMVAFATIQKDLVEFDPAVEELLFPFHLPKNIYGCDKPPREQMLDDRRRRNFAK
jgi:hypothetical protein